MAQESLWLAMCSFSSQQQQLSISSILLLAFSVDAMIYGADYGATCNTRAAFDQAASRENVQTMNMKPGNK